MTASVSFTNIDRDESTDGDGAVFFDKNNVVYEETILTQTQDFECVARITPVPQPVGGLEISFRTRWKGARRPNESQTAFRLCLQNEGRERLIQLLTAGADLADLTGKEA